MIFAYICLGIFIIFAAFVIFTLRKWHREADDMLKVAGEEYEKQMNHETDK